MLCFIQRHHEWKHITMLYSLGSNGKFIRCYRCDTHVPKPRGPRWLRNYRLGR